MNNICTRKMIVKEVVGMFYSSHRMEPCYCTTGNCTNLSREHRHRDALLWKKMRYQKRCVIKKKGEERTSFKIWNLVLPPISACRVVEQMKKHFSMGRGFKGKCSGKIIISNYFKFYIFKGKCSRDIMIPPSLQIFFIFRFFYGKLQRGDHHSSFLLNLIEILAHPLGKLARNQPLE